MPSKFVPSSLWTGQRRPDATPPSPCTGVGVFFSAAGLLLDRLVADELVLVELEAMEPPALDLPMLEEPTPGGLPWSCPWTVAPLLSASPLEEPALLVLGGDKFNFGVLGRSKAQPEAPRPDGVVQDRRDRLGSLSSPYSAT
jgi:hypothetical protein